MICVVGFKMNRANSIGYRKLKSPENASAYVQALLKRGAEVISIRVVKP